MRRFVVLLTVVSVSLSGMAIASQPQLSGAANTNNPTALQGSFLYEQLPAPPELLLSAASQEFPDVPSFTIFAADDFTVPDGQGWNVQDLHSFFTTGNGSGGTTGNGWRCSLREGRHGRCCNCGDSAHSPDSRRRCRTWCSTWCTPACAPGVSSRRRWSCSAR